MADFNVAVIESDPALRSQLIADLGERVRAAAFPTIESLEERLEDGTPVVALLGPSCADSAGLIAVERLTRSRPEVGTVLMVDDAVHRRAAAGAARRCEGRAGRAGRRPESSPSPSSGSVARSLRSQPTTLATEAIRRPGRIRRGVITVFSTKGGAGKSVIAANLAVVAGQRGPTGPSCSSTPTCSSATSR